MLRLDNTVKESINIFPLLYLKKIKILYCKRQLHIKKIENYTIKPLVQKGSSSSVLRDIYRRVLNRR